MSTPTAALGPSAARWDDGRAAAVAFAGAGTLSVVLAMLQAQWGPLLDGFGLSGVEVPITAAVVGLVDAAVVTGFLALAVWTVGRLARAPRAALAASALVVAASALAAVAIELTACVLELLATGEAPERLAISPARWTDVTALSGASLSNLAVYAVLAWGTTRRLGWSRPAAAALVALVAAVATAAGALG